MPSYLEAVDKILANVRVMEVETKPLFESAGQVLAEDVHSDVSLPASPTAGPDGYAVQSADIAGAGKTTPAILRIVETVGAGHQAMHTVEPGTAIRIMTGSVIPKGADCVVRFEDTDEPDNKSGPNKNNPSEVKIYATGVSGSNIQKAGVTVTPGALVLPKGTCLGAAQISALAAIGRCDVKVMRRPVIAVIATGDELIELGEPLAPAKSYNCNSAAIATLVSHYGGIPRLLGVARDDEGSVMAKLQEGMHADAIITSGGASKGDYDLIRLVLSRIGEVTFSRINMGPGAAVAFGRVVRRSTDGGDIPVPVFALAGPPHGCLVNMETLVRPAVFKMLGLSNLEHPVVEAIAQDAIPDAKPMTFVKWTRVDKIDGEYQVRLNAADGTSALATMAAANSLTIIPAGRSIQQGDRIQVLILDWRRI